MRLFLLKANYEKIFFTFLSVVPTCLSAILVLQTRQLVWAASNLQTIKDGCFR